MPIETTVPPVAGRKARATIVPVILAAGESSRMGYPKALLPLGQGIFVTQILDILKELDLAHPRVVLGFHADQVIPRLVRYSAQILVNDEPGRGQLSSIKLALTSVHPDCSGCLLWPVDQPCVPAGLVRDLVELFVRTGAPLVLPQCGQKRGHPAIFGRVLFSELLETPLQQGARTVVVRHINEIALLPTAETATVFDVDTPEDYLRLMGETVEAALSRQKESGDCERTTKTK